MADLHFLDSRAPAWGHRAMTQFDHPLSAADAVRAADLDFDILKVPIQAPLPSGEVVALDDQFALVNPRTRASFGIVGRDYTYLQNRDLADLLDQTLAAHYPVAALGETLNGEGVVFVLDAGGVDIAGDSLHLYFLVVETRSGKRTLQWAFTPLRFWCTNTLMTSLSRALALAGARHDRRIRANALGGLQLIAAAQATRDQTLGLYDAMARRRLAGGEVVNILARVYPHPTGARLREAEESFKAQPSPYLEGMVSRLTRAHLTAVEAQDARRTMAQQLYDYYRTPVPAHRGTLWALYNAAVEAEDHTTGRGGREDSVRQSALMGDRARRKVQALRVAEATLTGTLDTIDIWDDQVIEGELVAA